MLLRLPNVPARLATVFFALLLGATLAYLSIRNARADYYANLATRAGYETAARLEPENAVNWYLLGRYWQYTLDEPDTRRAILNYRHALSLNPHSAPTWLDLAAAYESEGDLQNARSAFLQAKVAYPLSADVSWRYGNLLLRQDQSRRPLPKFAAPFTPIPSAARKHFPAAGGSLPISIPSSTMFFLRTATVTSPSFASLVRAISSPLRSPFGSVWFPYTPF